MTVEIKSVFDRLRFMFKPDVVLAHYDPEKRSVIETDASDFVSGGMFFQYDENGVLRSITFLSKKHNSTKCNYEIYDKKFMTIIKIFEE